MSIMQQTHNPNTPTRAPTKLKRAKKIAIISVRIFVICLNVELDVIHFQRNILLNVWYLMAFIYNNLNKNRNSSNSISDNGMNHIYALQYTATHILQFLADLAWLRMSERVFCVSINVNVFVFVCRDQNKQ